MKPNGDSSGDACKQLWFVAGMIYRKKNLCKTKMCEEPPSPNAELYLRKIYPKDIIQNPEKCICPKMFMSRLT
jgi:hypothetical protein